MKPNPVPRRHHPLSLAEAFRLTHERWLNRAVKHPKRYPTIPSLRVDAGGFDRLTSSPLGRAWADQWWHDTFRSMEKDAGDP
ncbi:MAG: hypothetical protein RIB58_07910 [Phycisphaerales bacterium]|jgi:hypothetical protein